MKKKILALTNSILLSLSSYFSLINQTSFSEASPTYPISNITELWGEKLETFLNQNYSVKENSTVEGAYYKVNLMGHKQWVKYGEFKLLAKSFETYYPDTSVGLVDDLTLTAKKTYTFSEETISTVETKIAVLEMVEASLLVNSDGCEGQVGATGKITTEYTVSNQTVYASSLTQTLETTSHIDLKTIPSDKKTFSIKRVACYLNCEIKESVTKEKRLIGGWSNISETHKYDYYVNYFIGEIITFCYNDNTFGDTKMGIYKLDQIIKEY